MSQRAIRAARYSDRVKWVSRGLIAVVVLLHLYIAWFEIFAWIEVGPDVFPTLDPAIFEGTTDIAANQGVYNLFLAVGLVWSLLIGDISWSYRVAMCFLAFVAVAGITASATIELSSGLPQLIPSVLAMVATSISYRAESKSAILDA